MSGAQDVTRPNPVPTFFNPRDANKLFGPKPRNPTTLGHEIPRPLRSPEHQASRPFQWYRHSTKQHATYNRHAPVLELGLHSRETVPQPGPVAADLVLQPALDLLRD